MVFLKKRGQPLAPALPRPIDSIREALMLLTPQLLISLLNKTNVPFSVSLLRRLSYWSIPTTMGIPDTDYVYGQSMASAPPQAKKSRKRKADTLPSTSKVQTSDKEVIDLTADLPPKKRKKKEPNEGKRLRRFRSHPPQSYQEIRARALTQRMFVLDRERDTPPDQPPTEIVSLAGTTGNVYTITIDQTPSCNCPHAQKGNQCKHIIYVLARVLRVPEHLEYQLAFLSSELRQIFAQAPPLPSEQADGGANDGNRKPVEGECPICCVDFEPENSDEEVVYCKAACGNNVHKECFQQWAATKQGGSVTCPFCRTPWHGDEDTLKKVAKSGKLNEDGYVNMASQLGFSGERDYSTYHPHWVQRQFGYDYF